jgi:hypothetical protein
VHYCMPGPVDAWSTLVFNWLAAPGRTAGAGVLLGGGRPSHHRRDQWTARADHINKNAGADDARGGGGGSGSGGRSGGAARSRFFSVPLSEWLSQRAASAKLEGGWHAPGKLSRNWWWPFNCT